MVTCLGFRIRTSNKKISNIFTDNPTTMDDMNELPYLFVNLRLHLPLLIFYGMQGT